MSDSRRRVVAVAISTFAILAAGPGYAQLKPKVRVLTNANAPVPPECAQGTVAPPPRVEAPPLAPVSPAPSQGGLSTSLRAVQQAAERNDYDAFRSSLAAARSAAASYTRGGERDSAQNVLAVDSDLEQVWEFAQTNRTGAFYGDENRAVMEIARRYGAPPPLHIGGQTLYPTHELREIVTREASKRLAGLGIHVASRSPRTRTRVAETTAPKAHREPSTKIVEAQPMTPQPRVHKHRSTPRPATHSASHAKPATPSTHVAATTPPHRPVIHPAAQTKKPATPPTRIATASPPPAPRKSVPAPQTATVAPAPVPAPVPVPQPVTVTTATVAPAPPPAPAPVTTTTAPPAPVTETQTASTETSASGTDAFSTTAAATDTTATTGSAPAPRPVASGRSNMALRIFVVLIAIGLLIALFRASS